MGSYAVVPVCSYKMKTGHEVEQAMKTCVSLFLTETDKHIEILVLLDLDYWTFAVPQALSPLFSIFLQFFVKSCGFPRKLNVK